MVTLAGSNRGPIAVDSNLLLLLVIGTWNLRSITTHKRLSGFAVSDFYLVRDFVASFQSVVTTAHVLAEVSNLAGVATGLAKGSIYRSLARVIVTLDEKQIPSVSAIACPEFSVFGLTDAALSILCREMPLLTEDGRLAAHLRRNGLNAWTLENLKWSRNQACDVE